MWSIFDSKGKKTENKRTIQSLVKLEGFKCHNWFQKCLFYTLIIIRYHRMQSSISGRKWLSSRLGNGLFNCYTYPSASVAIIFLWKGSICVITNIFFSLCVCVAVNSPIWTTYVCILIWTLLLLPVAHLLVVFVMLCL